MKIYKLVDFWGSLVLIFASLLYAIAVKNEYSMLGYFIVGGWQLLSMIVHALNGWFTQAGGRRRIYHFAVLCCFMVAALGLLVHLLLVIELFVLLFAAPLMAAYYAWICYAELRIIASRPLAQLR